MANRVPRIERTINKFYVPHGDGEIGFAFPSFGPDTYQSIGKQILNKGLRVPTGDYTASLAHTAYCDSIFSDNSEFRNVRNLTGTNWLWVYNQCLWKDNGVIVIPDSQARGISEEFDDERLEELENLVNGEGSTEFKGVRFSKDRNVRFAPLKTYEFGEHTSDSLASDGFVIASCDIEGARKLGEASANLPNRPLILGVVVSKGNKPELRPSALAEFNFRLRLDGYWDGDFGCTAFGVS